MEKIQVILKEDVEHVGKSGELVMVKPGYGRNYLIPRGLALVATKNNVARLEHERKSIESRNAKLHKDAESLAERLSGVTLQFERQVGENDKLFGSVTSHDIAEGLVAQGFAVDRKKINLPEPIRALGQYSVEVKLGRSVSASVKTWVVAKQ